MPRNRVPVTETLLVTQLVKKNISCFMEPEDPLPPLPPRIVRVLVVTILVQVNPVHTLPSYFLRIILISFTHLRLCLKVCRVAQSVQILATCWTVRGSNPGGGEIFRTCPGRLWGQPSLLYNGYRVFLGVKSGRDVTLSPHRLLVPWSTPPMGRMACTEPQCL